MSFNNEIAETVGLLQNSRASDFSVRYKEAEKRILAHLEESTNWLLPFCLHAVETGAGESTLVEQIISFLDETDAGVLAERLVALNLMDHLPSLAKQLLVQYPAHAQPAIVAHFTKFEAQELYLHKSWPNPCFHVIFDLQSELSTQLPLRERHPTFRLPATDCSLSFGGTGKGQCPSCNQDLIHLVTLENMPEIMGISLPQLMLETCPTCYGKAYFRHNEEGYPARIEPMQIEGFQFKNVPLSPQRVHLAPTPLRWQRQLWASGWQNLSKAGGLPTWIQGEDIPFLPGSFKPMQFLVQIDSDLPTIDGGSILWGSGGILYVFWDDSTRTSCIFGQWT